MNARRVLLPLLAAVSLAAPPAAFAVELLSPGALSRAHASLEGTTQCTKCHPAGGKLSPEACLACHDELRGRVAAGRGLHGRMAPGDRACEKCHHEHEGRDFALVIWGKEGRAAFDHARTGTPLAGKHKKAACAKCHDPRLVADPAVKALLAKRAGRVTYLGAPVACWPCHADEHRGQLGTDCAKCHVDEKWRPAPRFNHAKAGYPLAGLHAKVACGKCHPRREAPAPELGASQVRVVQPDAVHYKGLKFGACGDCHKDPHAGKFGAACTSCHVVDGWKKLTGSAAEKAFHEKTKYPLRGGHVSAPCASCHGPFPGEKQKLKGLAFANCTDCHADAHLGQLTPAQGDLRTCDRCHGVEGWLPVRYELEDHARSRYPLEGGHRAVACLGCHPKDPAAEARFPAEVRKRLEARHRPVKVAQARLKVEKSADCRTCHKDPHRGQFDARLAGKGCEACHSGAAWRALEFDHARDSKYPLTGRHAKAACGSCHRPGADGLVRYRPLATACGACHADPHAAQFAAAAGTDCARCHETEGWKKPLKFVHREPFTKFRLEGKHAPLACEKCHPEVAVGAGAKARRYKPLPAACEGCHADFHKGAFRGYVP
ncbi:MAG TPA: cytochrome c3 family protein [Anaeromyxobacteraceae bacterium]|nr:cytochrome c3 family protein [Anaeromyxobacteraceae bacterium]